MWEGSGSRKYEKVGERGGEGQARQPENNVSSSKLPRGVTGAQSLWGAWVFGAEHKPPRGSTRGVRELRFLNTEPPSLSFQAAGGCQLFVTPIFLSVLAELDPAGGAGACRTPAGCSAPRGGHTEGAGGGIPGTCSKPSLLRESLSFPASGRRCGRAEME